MEQFSFKAKQGQNSTVPIAICPRLALDESLTFIQPFSQSEGGQTSSKTGLLHGTYVRTPFWHTMIEMCSTGLYSPEQKHMFLLRKSEILLFKVLITNILHTV